MAVAVVPTTVKRAELARDARIKARRGPRMCSTSWLFSLQMYSMSSQPGRSVCVYFTVNGFAYAPGSSTVVTISSSPTFVRV